MKKRLLILWMLLTALYAAQAQQLVSTAGDVYQNSSGTLSWTVGEVLTKTYANSNMVLLQGFQQGNQISIHINASDTQVCHGNSVVLEAISTGGGPNHSYSWSSNPSGLNSPSPMLSVQPQVSAWYIVQVSDGGINPVAEDSIFIQVNSSVFNIDFVANPTSFTTQPFTTTITNQTANANNYKWNWNLGDGNQSQAINPMHTYQYNGTYSISVVATDTTTGCFDTLSKLNYINCNGGGTNPCTLVAEIHASGSPLICQGDSLKLSATYNLNASYLWIRDGVVILGATDSVLYAKDAGMYQVMLSDTVCSVFSNLFNLAHYPVSLPVISAFGSITPCSNDSMRLEASSGFNNLLWNTGDTTSNLWVKQSGHYTVSGEDIFMCRHTSIPYVVNASLLPIPELCIVGVDSASGHNRIVWQRQANPLIDSFRIYRETTVANQYQLISSQAYGQSSMYVDVTSNPRVKAYRYKISAIDTCGTETPLSDYHKTIHLTINAGLNNSWNLIWDGYQGFNFGSYRIYRGTDSLNMQFLTQIQSTLTSYTDLNPPTGKVYYQIEVVSPHPCYPDSIYAKAQTNYNTSRSNLTNTSKAPNIGYEDIQGFAAIRLFPNPNDGSFIMELNCEKNEQAKLQIFNPLGQLIMEEALEVNRYLRKQIQLNSHAKGVYYVRLQSNQGLVYREKVIIQ